MEIVTRAQKFRVLAGLETGIPQIVKRTELFINSLLKIHLGHGSIALELAQRPVRELQS